jgi:citrate lyase beta subunit
MKSYFFIPASKLNKIPDIKKIGVKDIIVDFEDAILSNQRNDLLNQCSKNFNGDDFWLRIPVRDEFEDNINLGLLNKAQELGFNKIVLPKIKTLKELIGIISKFKKNKFILLIEHPKLFIEIKGLFQMNKNLFQTIKGIGIGSHDLMTLIGAKHEYDQLDYPRKEMLYLSKAYDIEAIDIASMNISNDIDFRIELQYALNNGFDSKFIIHPRQFEWMGKIESLNFDTIIWAKKIVSYLPDSYNGGSIEPFIVDDIVIEKPHVKKAIEILKKNKENGK